MRKLALAIFSVLACITVFVSCTGKEKSGEAVVTADIDTPSAAAVKIDNETRLIIQELKDNGDFVNSREFPSLIKASVVKEGLDKKEKLHIIDLRNSGVYAGGHIPGSVNKSFEDLPSYFETGIKPFEFEKIILVCDDGQISSYTASLLRLMGYGNVYAMRWGMSSWNRKFAEKSWLEGLSAQYENKLEQKTNEKPVAESMPLLKTGFSTGSEVAAERFKNVFADGTKKVLISPEDVFSNPQQYYVINYERKDKYDDAHIPGAVRYKPGGTLGFTDEMATIPTGKTIVVYCGTGHNSGFVTAYLRLLGYDARTLQYGNNGFMHDWMTKDAANLSWLPFSEADINDYAVVK